MCWKIGDYGGGSYRVAAKAMADVRRHGGRQERMTTMERPRMSAAGAGKQGASGMTTASNNNRCWMAVGR